MMMIWYNSIMTSLPQSISSLAVTGDMALPMDGVILPIIPGIPVGMILGTRAGMILGTLLGTPLGIIVLGIIDGTIAHIGDPVIGTQITTTGIIGPAGTMPPIGIIQRDLWTQVLVLAVIARAMPPTATLVVA